MLCELFAQAWKGRAVLYVLPTDTIVYDFTPRRVDRLVEKVPFYRNAYSSSRKASDTKKQKTIFGVDCNFGGSNSVLNFYEKPCDVLIIDEYDMCEQQNLTAAYDRLESSQYRAVRILGNPSIVGEGINRHYENSNKSEWMMPCSHCGKWQALDWFQNVVDIDDAGHYSLRSPSGSDTIDDAVVCKYCHKPIDRLAPGEWIAEHPDNPVHGYLCSSIFGNPLSMTIRRLFGQFIDAQSNPTALQIFYNNRLGVPFSAAGSRIDDAILAGCAADYTMPQTATNTVAGVDVGGRLHVNISEIKDGKRRKVFVGSLPLDLNALDFVVKQYGVRVGVMDALPETKFAKDFARSHPGWYMCHYLGNDDKDLSLRVNHVERTVSVGRTESLDMSFAEYLDRRVEFPKDYRHIDGGDFVAHMKAPTRIFVEPKGMSVGRFVWQEGSQPDHHRHSDNYEALAAKLYGGGSLIRVL